MLLHYIYGLCKAIRDLLAMRIRMLSLMNAIMRAEHAIAIGIIANVMQANANA
jgi:hypothetical protein